jgi:hypothetical protein
MYDSIKKQSFLDIETTTRMTSDNRHACERDAFQDSAHREENGERKTLGSRDMVFNVHVGELYSG